MNTHKINNKNSNFENTDVESPKIKLMQNNAPIIISILSACVALFSFFVSFYSRRERKEADLINAQKFVSDRLYELDKLSIAYPKIIKTLAEENRRKNDNYFEVYHQPDEFYHQLKSYIYLHINYYDEVVNLFERESMIKNYLEYESWRLYIMYLMENPLVREIYNKEYKIWGSNFNNFIIENRKDKKLMIKIEELKNENRVY